MDDDKKAILNFLRLLRGVAKHNLKLQQQLELVYAGPADFLLRHGKWYVPEKLPKRFRRGEPRACFHNSAFFARRHPEYRYVEGYACCAGVGLPVHHAWVTDGVRAFERDIAKEGWPVVAEKPLGHEFPTGPRNFRAYLAQWRARINHFSRTRS